MKLFYVRWPNGHHTLAFAKDRHDLWDLLDESGDPVAGRFKELTGSGHRFAFDFVTHDEGVSFEYRDEYESLDILQHKCCALPVEALVDGSQFFEGRTGL